MMRRETSFAVFSRLSTTVCIFKSSSATPRVSSPKCSGLKRTTCSCAVAWIFTTLLPDEDEDGRPRRFAYPPSLILVDGGPPQVAAAQRAMDELGITDIALAGIAKRLEEIWLPGEEYPVILPRTSEALFLVQRLRDEAHRFAITYHRSKRGRAMQASALDGIPGLGPARRRALLDRFVTVSAIREASEEELTEVDGIGPALAGQITAALTSAQENGADPDTAEDALGVTVDMATGEILEG